MATYKVLQDIEAEDTLIGPLTVRQCLYAAIAVIAMYLSFMAVVKHAAFLVILFLPFILFGLFFAFPWSKQQPTEVWALAKVRFYFKPRVRIWNQTGVKELVTITVPKAVKKTYTSNLSPNEVKSRLKALADTIDSRGWAVKNVDLGYYRQTSVLGQDAESDRLVNAMNMPQAGPGTDAPASEDIFDVQNNPVAQKFDAMMAQAAGVHRQQLMQQMAQQPEGGSWADQPAPGTQLPAPADYWHMRPAQPEYPQVGRAIPILPAPRVTALRSLYNAPVNRSTASSAASSRADNSAGRGQSAATGADPSAQPQSDQAVTAPTDPAILELANNNDLNVATIQREAQARHPDPPDEVVISFH